MENIFLSRVRAEISLSAAKKNLETLTGLLDPNRTKPACVIKADGYGHGDVRLMELYQSMGVDFFCVSNLAEALKLRRGGCGGDVLILSWSDPADADILAENDIIGTAVSVTNAEEISRRASKPVRIHIKIDTGMRRVGLSADDAEKCAAEAAKIAAMKNIRAEGIFTHFAAADNTAEENIRFTEEQKRRFFAVSDALERLGVRLIHRHCLNSAGAALHYDSRSTLARFGIVLYGLKPDRALDLPISLEPVMRLRSVVSHIKTVHKGDTVSYGRTYTAEDDRIIATVPCGYADGYPRLLSGRGEVIINGKRARIAGRVCMDQTMIDVTELGNISVGDEVTLIGRDGGEIVTADDIAELCGTIGYEIVCGISGRVPRVYTDF